MFTRRRLQRALEPSRRQFLHVLAVTQADVARSRRGRRGGSCRATVVVVGPLRRRALLLLRVLMGVGWLAFRSRGAHRSSCACRRDCRCPHRPPQRRATSSAMATIVASIGADARATTCHQCESSIWVTATTCVDVEQRARRVAAALIASLATSCVFAAARSCSPVVVALRCRAGRALFAPPPVAPTHARNVVVSRQRQRAAPPGCSSSPAAVAAKNGGNRAIAFFHATRDGGRVRLVAPPARSPGRRRRR